ncbi:hypothetical protein Tco_1114829, partial [Tanacetum coccineum]
MDITRAEQIALYDSLVASTNRLKIGKSNLRLSSDLKSKEASLQVVYDVLKLTPFYKAFQITADVPEIYMQEFWATAIVHHHSIRFKMNNKKHIVNLKYFREMLQICPKLPNQQFEEPPFEEAILTFLRDLGHSGEIKLKSFGGMYHKKNVDYAYLLWEDFVYQVENKNVKRSNEMYYPRFTKFTTIKIVSRHEDTQLYGAILPDELTNEAIKDYESYKEYYAIASGAEPPKTKASVKKKQVGSDKTKTPPTAKGKRLKTLAKAAKPAKKKQPAKTCKAKGLTVLSEVALTEPKQMKLATKTSLIQTHSSHASGLGADKGTGGTSGVPDVPTYESDDEKSLGSLVTRKMMMMMMTMMMKTMMMMMTMMMLMTMLIIKMMIIRRLIQTTMVMNLFILSSPLMIKKKDKMKKIMNKRGEELDEEGTNEEDEANELYRDVNVNLEGRDTKMIDALRTIVQTTQVIEDTHLIITSFNPEGQQQSSFVSSGFVSNMLNPSPHT